MSIPPSSRHPGPSRRSLARLQEVPKPESPEYVQFLADVDAELRPVCDEIVGAPEPGLTAEELLAHGFPVASSAIDERQLRDVADERVDVHAAAVVSLAIGRLRRCLKQLPPLERRLVSLRWGVGGEPLAAELVASRMGMSVTAVTEVEDRVAANLREVLEHGAGAGLPRPPAALRPKAPKDGWVA